MSAFEQVPEPWQEKIDQELARGADARAVQLLEMWSTQFTLTPWVMERLGQLQLAKGRRVEAGRAFFWSGVRADDPERQQCIDQFLQRVGRSPRKLVRTLPPRARRPIGDMPAALRDELARLRVTDAVVASANRQSSRIVGVLAMIVFGGVWLVGLWTCGRWLFGWIRSVFG